MNEEIIHTILCVLLCISVVFLFCIRIFGRPSTGIDEYLLQARDLDRAAEAINQELTRGEQQTRLDYHELRGTIDDQREHLDETERSLREAEDLIRRGKEILEKANADN